MDSTIHTRDLEAVRRRRADLRESIRALEEALAAAAAGRAVVWGGRVQATVQELVTEFDEHVDVTEGPDGLHQAILAGDLRLANAVNALSEAPAVIAAEIAALNSACEPPVTAADVALVREQGTEALAHLIRHRQRGADLVYEAYETDIGGGD